MNNALILGGGSKLGLELSLQLSNNYNLTVITESLDLKSKIPNMNVEKISWDNLDNSELDRVLYRHTQSTNFLDLIVFNQNSKAGPNTSGFFDPIQWTCEYDKWLNGYRNDCMVPYYVLHKLHAKINANTKICWMFSSLINDYIDIDPSKHAAYRGIKLTNYFIMQSFSIVNPALFFGIDPGHTTDENRKDKAQKIVTYIQTANRSAAGRVYNIEKLDYWQPLASPKQISITANGPIPATLNQYHI